MFRIQFLLLALTLTLTLGPGVSAQEQATGISNTPPPPKPRVQLKEGNWEQVQSEIRKHRGKLVVLDLWSTSCLPCMKEFPKLVELQKAYPKEVVCLSLNLDYAGIKTKPPEYYRPRVIKFLTAVNADFQNYLCVTEANEFFDSINLNSIPAVFVYGPNGKLIKRFDDKMLEPGEEEPFSYEEDINPYVKSLVGRLRAMKRGNGP